MTDRPILFSAPMVRALIEGRKTQTRRLLKLRGHKQFSEFGPSDTPGYDWHFRRADGCWCDHRNGNLPLPYAIGDRLWVRETWGMNHYEYERGAIPKHRPDDLTDQYLSYRATEGDCEIAAELHYRSSLHMPRWASRLTLTVTSLRVQQLHDISDEDAIDEGLEWTVPGMWSVHHSLPIIGHDPRSVYAQLWNHIHGPGAWEANPWITAISFTAEQRNIDA